MITIRPATVNDQNNVWNIINEVIGTSKYYAFHPGTGKETMLAYWFGEDKKTYVAIMEDQIAGTFIIRDNQPGLGNHIANASYMTSPTLTSRGVGTAMAEYSFKEAKELGYRALQFNLVLKSNTRAVNLWLRLGFGIIGEIPGAFRDPENGFTDAYIMFKSL